MKNTLWGYCCRSGPSDRIIKVLVWALVVQLAACCVACDEPAAKTAAKENTVPKINADGGDPATPPDGEQEIVPKVNAIGELTDGDGKIVGTLFVLQLSTPPNRLEEAASDAQHPQWVQTGSGSPFTRWVDRPVSVVLNKDHRDSSSKNMMASPRKHGVSIFLRKPPGYTVIVVFPVELSTDAVSLTVFDPVEPHKRGVKPDPPIEIVIPERKNRPHLPSLHAEVAHVGELKNDKVEVRLQMQMDWQSHSQERPLSQSPSQSLLLNNIWVEAVRIGDIQSKGEIHNYLDVSKDRLHRTPLLSCTLPTVPKVDAPILLKIRGVDTWVSGDAKPQ